ncbi:MAG: hypothetical protein P8L78_06590 [Mariniblastus sp.]|nr:hypothetical protein [Mariniblastus sp.]
MSNETVEFNSHSLDNVDTIEDSIAEEAVVIVEEERPALTGYELVADMMRRQDDVINELDDLNNRIEAAIQEITDARKIEDEATQDFQHEVDEDLQLGKAA